MDGREYIEVDGECCIKTEWGPFPIGDAALPLKTRRAINKRAKELADQLAREAYDKHRGEMRDAILKRRMDADQISDWMPASSVSAPTTSKD